MDRRHAGDLRTWLPSRRRRFIVRAHHCGPPLQDPTCLQQQIHRISNKPSDWHSRPSGTHPRDGTAYRIVGHAAFEKALSGDYISLIAAQNYLSKASDILGNDSWIQERLFYANQALHSGKNLQSLWKARVPAGK